MSETGPSSTGNLPEFSVSELSLAIRRAVEEGFPLVRVRGEISGLKSAASGHTYFDLKDDKAVLNAIIWKQQARALRLKPEAGMEVVCTGRVTTYPGSSRYQLIVEQIELAGQGALMALLEERRRRLAAEGLFDTAAKQKLPFLPSVVGVVTSPTGAVIRDIMHRLNDRFPRRVLLWPVAVQGEKAAAEIAAAIAGFNSLDGAGLPRPDLLIVARGGGSLEDLMAFNDEAVVRAAAQSAIPLISAVGHETDTTLLDFAADVRAPTPSAAAELAVPVRSELIAGLIDLDRRGLRCFLKGLSDRRRHLSQLARVLPRPEALFAQSRQRFDNAAEKLVLALKAGLNSHRAGLSRAAALMRPHIMGARFRSARDRMEMDAERLGRGLDRRLRYSKAELLKASALLRPRTVAIRIGLWREGLRLLQDRAERCHRARLGADAGAVAAAARLLESISYRAVLARGFAVVRGADGSLRRRAASLAPGEALTLVFADGEAPAAAAGARGAKTKKSPADQGSLF